MQAHTSRIRTIVAAVTVALAVAAVPAVSHAAINRGEDGGAVPRTQPKPKPKPAQERFKAAWSAGIPGYGDAECTSLLNDSNAIMDRLDEAIAANDAAAISRYMALLEHVAKQLSNCVVLMS
ncbi:MAG: hypothetical protein Q8K79_16480 [Solirubrobacteraceae bacterium]|nr:hypothetical protein [Solirubrobacteraceae bacterium]